MKTINGLILGTAVAFAATAGAQAADLPVKAKPVSYVKICPQYGPGFYYIPGTDICLRVGGLVLAEAGYHAAGATVTLAHPPAGAVGAHTAHELAWRSRGYLAIDARQSTPYGTLRAYIYGGIQQVSGPGSQSIAPLAPAAANYAVNNGAFMQFAFIQFAGFTAGTATSFFDFAPNWLTLNISANPYNWANLFAYTANFGNGFSATISIEDNSTTRIGNGSAAAIAFANVSQDTPDVVGNVRLDQAWGSAQVMAAAHNNRYTFGDDWGYAVGLGIEIKLPFLGSASAIKFSAVHSEGAIEYTGLSGSSSGAIGGINVGFNGGVVVRDNNSGVGQVSQLTEGASFMLQLRHTWTPQLRSVFHAGYNDAYNLNIAGGFGGVQVVQYGTSLQYSPVPNLTLALDVVYTEVDANNVETDKVATWFRVTRPF